VPVFIGRPEVRHLQFGRGSAAHIGLLRKECRGGGPCFDDHGVVL